MKYTKVTDDVTGQESIHRQNEDGSISIIPVNEANADYQAYLADEA